MNTSIRNLYFLIIGTLELRKKNFIDNIHREFINIKKYEFQMNGNETD